MGVGVHVKSGVQGVGSPGGRFIGVESDQRRERSSGEGERVGGMESGWMEMEARECSSDGWVQGAKSLGYQEAHRR